MRELAGAMLRIVVAMLFALATALAGGLHGTPPRDAALAAYALPDGTLPEICGDHPGAPAGLEAGCCLDCLTVAPPVQPAMARAPTGAIATRVAVPVAHVWIGGPEWRPAAARAPPSSAS